MGVEARTVGDVVAGLERVAAELPPSDGVKWFALIYGESTKAIAALIERGGFESPEFMPRLVVRFGNAFLGAVAGSEMVTNAWGPVFERRYDPGVAPLQFATAGYNSHMGYEMPLGLVQGWHELGVEPTEDGPEHRDFERLHATTNSVHPSVREYLRTEAAAQLGRPFRGVDELVAHWDAEAARKAAWTRATVIWKLWDDHEIVAPYLTSLDRSVGLISRLLLVPTGGA